MRGLIQAIRLSLAASAVFAGSVAAASPANAVATPAEACGSNYHEIDHHDIPGARIHLLYNGSTDCVVTTKNTPGTKTRMLAAVGKYGDSGLRMINDDGDYAQYAGPVRVTAPGVCIDWGGAADPGWNAWYSGPSHCG